MLPIDSRAAFVLAAAHGAADAVRPPQQLALYAAAFLPLPGVVCSSLFLAASVSHFACDVGLSCSALLHVLIVALATRSLRRATQLLMSFMCGVHVPRLVRNLVRRGELAPLLCVALAGALLWKQQHTLLQNGQYELSHTHQLVVCVHVLINLLSPL